VTTYDAIFLGTSPNALAAAARLARAGQRVLLLETRAAVGGPTVTETFAPGFRAETGVTSAALDPEVARDLGLSLDVLHRDTITGLGPAPLTLRAGHALPSEILHAVALLQAIYASDPPTLPVPDAADAASLGALAARLEGLGARRMHEVLRLLFMSARDFFGETVSSEAERALLSGVAVRAVSEGPFASGTLLNFLHHQAVGDGLFRATVRGGLGKLAEALAACARAAGAEIRCDVPGPLHVEVVDGVASGVRLGDGTRIEAKRVVSDHDARTTFTQLVSPRELDPEQNRAIGNLRRRGSVARINLALRELPAFAGVETEALRGTLVVAPDVAYLEKAWDQAKRGVASSHPYLEVTLPTIDDPSLAPPGQHVLSAWVQYVPYGRGGHEALLESVVAALAAHAPRLPELILHHQVLLPEDLESRFGLAGGHLYGGEVNWSQSFWMRPLPGFSHYRTPIENLYLAGSAAHPAGYSGRSGWNLARALLGG
jgi:phytoene dehydrogenase-like protein